MTNLSKRQLKKQIKEDLYQEIQEPVDVFQSRPNTCVVFKITHEGVEHQVIGFSKVSWPDEWNEEYGVKMAIEKGISGLAKNLCESKPIQDLYQAKV